MFKTTNHIYIYIFKNMFPQKELELHFQAVLCGFGEYQCHAQIQNVCYPPVMNGILFFSRGR